MENPINPNQALPQQPSATVISQAPMPAPAPQQPQVSVQPAPVQPAPQMPAQPQQPAQPQPAAPLNSGTSSTPPMRPQMQMGGVPPRQPVRPLQGQPGGPSPRRLILGCLGFFFFSVMLFVIFVIAFVSQTSATGQNGLAAALGVDAVQLTNSLILLTNLIFGLVVMVTFFITVFGLFRAGMAPKTDAPARSRGYRQAGISGVIFLIMILLWVFVYIYLSGKQVKITPQASQTQGIVTVPDVTTKLTAPVDVKFDATKIPYNPNRIEITFYQWDFGDGSSSTSPTVTHTYRDIGQYNVKLSVTATDKQTNETLTQSFEKLVTVSEAKIQAAIVATPESGPAPLTVQFDASSSVSPNGQITTYEWDFKGQNSFRDSTGVSTEYTFDREGSYKVSLRVTDNTGQSATIDETITVGGPDIPTSVIDIPSDSGKYFVGKQYTFLGEKSTSPNGDINKYEWDFGDESPKANTRTATHTYKSAGLYEVILSVTDKTGKQAQSSQKITIETQESAPTAVISTDPTLGEKDKSLSGQAPFEVSFDASKSVDSDNDIVEYKWDFDGDNKVDAAGTTANYVYKTPGSYNATLTATDAAGNESSAVLVIKVAAQDLTARVTADKVEGTTPLTVTFDASSSTYPDGQITSYEWDFGDGSAKQIAASQISYKYQAIGTFTATVIAKSSDGKTSKADIVINVRPISLQACFTPSLEQGPAPLTLDLDPRCSQGAVAKYLWDFGDGQTSRIRKPSHTFDKPGSYKVTLEVSDAQNVVNTYNKDILVTGTVQ